MYVLPYRFCFAYFILNLRAISKYKSRVFFFALRVWGGLIFRGAYFWNFTLSQPGLNIPLYPELAQSGQMKTGPNVDRRKPVLSLCVCKCFFKTRNCFQGMMKQLLDWAFVYDLKNYGDLGGCHG